MRERPGSMAHRVWFAGDQRSSGRALCFLRDCSLQCAPFAHPELLRPWREEQAGARRTIAGRQFRATDMRPCRRITLCADDDETIRSN